MEYKRWATGEGGNFRERKKMQVSCTECGVKVEDLYLKTHMTQIHGICVPHTRGGNKVGGGPTTYVVSFPMVLQ